MYNSKRQAELTAIVDRRRRELSERPDISLKMRKLSESSSRNSIPQKPRNRRNLLGIILLGAGIATIITVVAVAAIAAAGGLWFHNQLTDPSSTALDFYSALHQQDYKQAYSFFSDDSQKQLSQDAFTKQFTDYDQLGGIVQSYTTQGDTKITGNQAVVTVLVVRRANQSQAQVQTVYLVQQGNDWRIERITLGDMVPAPAS